MYEKLKSWDTLLSIVILKETHFEIDVELFLYLVLCNYNLLVLKNPTFNFAPKFADRFHNKTRFGVPYIHAFA